MAITNNGTKLKIASGQIPSGFSAPAVTDFSDHEYKRELILQVDKATVQNADKATTLSNILTDATIGINKQVTDILTADYVGTNDVQAFSELVSLGHNVLPTAQSDFLGNAAVVYKCKVIVYVKTV